ncbi:MAG: hypothetical protein QXU98_03135 [Candidatus Parvarchaeota archaeon]
MNRKEIGGYFELELRDGKEYYDDAIKLNSGRNCFKYILLAQQPSKVYVPYYIDKSMKEESLIKLGIPFEFYHINKKLEIAKNIQVKNNEKILYNNYFSLKGAYVKKLAKIYGQKLIVDNTQAFFERPIQGIDTLYSVGSKFFGVPSGGYLYTRILLDEKFKQSFSYNSVTHLIGRADKDAASFFEYFQESKKKRNNQPIALMSTLTKKILSSIDYEKVRLIRERNFYYLHSYLKDVNELDVDFSMIKGPMVYPLLIKNESLRYELIKNKIYVATYWNEILDLKGASKTEKYLAKYLLPLPIDQRYDLSDMDFIVKTIKKEVSI